MKKKVILLVLLSVLLCVFAASALADADIDGVQLWEGGLYYATTPLKYASDGSNVYFVWVDSTGNSVIDYNDYFGGTETPASNYGITDGWRIPTKEEMADLFNTTKHGTSVSIDKSVPITCTITGNNETLILRATGYVCSQSEVDSASKDTEGHYATTGRFLYFDQNSSTCDFVEQECGGQVILVKDPPHTYQFTASGDTITATCASCPNLTLTVTGDAETVYSGSPVTMTLAGNTSTWKDLTGEDLPKIAYYSGDTLLTEAPTDVGTYTAKISVGSVTASKEFKINARSIH